MSIKQMFEQSVLTKTKESQIIIVTLADGQVAHYTKSILPLMIGDPMVKQIVDKQSGEIIYLA